MPAPWEAIASRKRAERHSKIPRSWLLRNPPSGQLDVRSIPETSGILSTRELEITSTHDATSLAVAIRAKRYTAEEVAVAFCKRAAIAQQVCNCLTEIMFDEGIARARWLDAEMKAGRIKGRLHGVPISLKDSFWVKGFDSSIGEHALGQFED
jgi:amidase